jgi:hypothetical protein
MALIGLLEVSMIRSGDSQAGLTVAIASNRIKAVKVEAVSSKTENGFKVGDALTLVYIL